MNRRSFLKTLLTGVAATLVAPEPTKLFTEPVDIGPVGDFVYYVTYQWEMMVINPRACAFITNIAE